ncbi:MAG: hypothetical protein A2284_11370 [Deltaproteobacteria bacterium RIFOXYA12_FULL_61_11]|nr:MAG: hypothetical protein A2284_11370 [Deltaproteobacteria bacterium RIFOXYA12_FULL_61_11]
MLHAIANIAFLTMAFLLLPRFFAGAHVRDLRTAVLVAVIYSVLHFLLFWLLALLSIPLILVSFGLFVFVINAFLLHLTDRLIDGFKLDDTRTTLLAALTVTIVSWLLRALVL